MLDIVMGIGFCLLDIVGWIGIGFDDLKYFWYFLYIRWLDDWLSKYFTLVISYDSRHYFLQCNSYKLYCKLHFTSLLIVMTDASPSQLTSKLATHSTH